MFKWAIDGIAIVVNPKNPVRNLSATEVQQIFAGRITNWKTIGWIDKPINLYTRDKASGTRTVFWKKALCKGEIRKQANFVPSNGAMKTAISTDPHGIGYLSVGYLDKSVAAVTFKQVPPTLDNVRNGT